MTQQLYLTTLGSAKLTAAANTGKGVQLTHFVVGSGQNVDFSGRLDSQSLSAPVYQGTIESISPTSHPNQYAIACVVPPTAGGFTIAEVGLLDSDGTLIWVGSLPSVQKPDSSSPATVDYRINCLVSVDNYPDAMTLIIDPNVVTATCAWVSANFIPRSALELLYPIGHPYWSALPTDPTPRFTALFGYPTYWRRVQGVELVALKDGDANIGLPRHQTGKQGITTANTSKPDTYPLYPLYLWIRYAPVQYNSATQANTTAQYQ